MAAKKLLEYLPSSAVGFAVGTWINQIRREREDAVLVDAALNVLGETRNLVASVEDVMAALAEVGGNFCSIVSASAGVIVFGGLVFAFLYKGTGGDGGRGPHGGDGDHN